MFSETHFIFMLFETNLVFMSFALMLFGNPQIDCADMFGYKFFEEKKQPREKVKSLLNSFSVKKTSALVEIG